jgi:hypothetical protein
MKHYKIDLNSQNSSTPWNFSNIFTPPIILGPNAEVALTSVRVWNSLKNISVSLNNNIFRYWNGSVWRLLSINEGTYSIEALNIAIKNGITGFSDTPDNITLIPNYTTLKVDITILGGYQIDFSYNDLYYLLGWPKALVSISGSGTLPANITLGITSWVVNANIVSPDSSYNNGVSSNSLYNFSPNVPAGSLIDLTPNNLLYLPLGTTTLSQINISLTDQLGNPLNQLSIYEPTNYTLVVRHD